MLPARSCRRKSADRRLQGVVAQIRCAKPSDLCAQVFLRESGLDVLCNNAGIMGFGDKATEDRLGFGISLTGSLCRPAMIRYLLRLDGVLSSMRFTSIDASSLRIC